MNDKDHLVGQLTKFWDAGQGSCADISEVIVDTFQQLRILCGIVKGNHQTTKDPAGQ